jgi:hypothetical protein
MERRGREGVVHQLVYALRFTGLVTTSDTSGSTLVAFATAPIDAFVTTMPPGAVSSTVDADVGGPATIESEVIFTGRTTFQELGTVSFGSSGDRLRFSTLGSGYLGPSPDPKVRHGTAMRRIDGGEGRFAGASGLITANFTLDGRGAVTEHHVGVIHLP